MLSRFHQNVSRLGAGFLLLAAIGAVPSIRPQEASEVLSRLIESDDEDIVEAVHEALAMAEEPADEDEDDEDGLFLQ